MFVSLRHRLITIAVLASSAFAAVALSATATAGTAASWRSWQLDGDRCWDAITMDANLNGYWETAWFDFDNDCRWDTRIWNSVGGDAFAESLTFDMNEDGRWEIWLADNNQREGFDVVYFDDNGDGYYDRWTPMPNAAPSMSLAEQLGQGSFGGTMRHSGAMGLVVYLSHYTRQAAWAPPDWDGDGCPDHIDSTRYRYGC